VIGSRLEGIADRAEAMSEDIKQIIKEAEAGPPVCDCCPHPSDDELSSSDVTDSNAEELQDPQETTLGESIPSEALSVREALTTS
jgi:hypothetical protein